VQVFSIHDIIANISAQTYDGDEVTLQNICYKPFGDICAIESVAQYWQLDRATFDSGDVSLKQCLAHWSTDCR
jgi:Niemann-Pick C1 protein